MQTYLAVIKLKSEPTILNFGPFASYEEAHTFAQAKFREYIDGKSAYVDILMPPVLFPSRRV